jgi:hypothetical protein
MIKYKAKFASKDTCVCIVDDTNQYDSWTRELVKNRADYTITNCTGMGYDVFVDRNVDYLLKTVAVNYRVAVVISPGTEFLNGDSFFKNIPENFTLLAHILDCGEGYFMIHPQCFVLNLEIYKSLDCPVLGQEQHFNTVETVKPVRSVENIHDDYTPLWIKSGDKNAAYKHVYYGWNLIKTIIEEDLIVEAFDHSQRNDKHYLYRDVDTSEWIYKRYNFCLTELVYHSNTGPNFLPLPECKIKQLIIPAAGMNWYDTIQNYNRFDIKQIDFYDYNESSLDWIKSQIGTIDNIKFNFHKVDIINDFEKFLNIINSNSITYIEFSNIFAYEATAAIVPLKRRLDVQNKLIERIKQVNKQCYIHFDQRAEDGFALIDYNTQLAQDITINQWLDLYLPMWHTYD